MTSTAADARAAGGCIFCGGARLTKEHVFPRWLVTTLTADVVGPNVTSERTRRSAAGSTSTQRWAAVDVASYTVRVVCATCNNGWMSDIETRAQAVLSPMVAGERTILSPAAQMDVAAWTALKGYIVEWALGDVIVASPAVRRALMDAKHPPGPVPVRLGAVERSGIPSSVTRIVYNVGRAGRQEGLAVCTTFALGCAVLQVCHGRGITIDWTAVSEPHTDHVPVNPPCPRDIQWPPAVVLDSTSLGAWERPIPASDPGGIAGPNNPAV
jgi:hypothetical protein